MGVDTNLYELVLVLHILAVIIGFGGMFVAGLYGAAAAKRPGADGLAVAQTTLDVTGRAPTVAVCAVPVLGILLILLSDDTWKFSEAWISLSFLLYIALMVLAVAVQVPTIRKLVALRAGGETAGSSEMQAHARTAGMVGGVVNLLWVAILFLMVFKPGH